MTTHLSWQFAAVFILAGLTASCSDSDTSWDDASSMLGKTTRVCGPLVSIANVSEPWGDASFFNLGADYPNLDRFTIVVWEESSHRLRDVLQGEQVCATGRVSLYKGVPQLELDSLSELSVPSLEEDMPEPDFGPGPY